MKNGDPKKLGLHEGLRRGVQTHRQLDGLWIEYGKDGVFERVAQALDLIKASDPLRYRRILRDIDRIVVAPLMTGAEAQYSREINACEIDEQFMLGERYAPELAASVIVHEATHARLEHMGFVYVEERRQRIEEICIRRECAFLAKVPGDVASERIDYLLQYEVDPLDFSAEAFARRSETGEREVLHYLGVPDWLVPVLFGIRSMVTAVRRIHYRIFG